MNQIIASRRFLRLLADGPAGVFAARLQPGARRRRRRGSDRRRLGQIEHRARCARTTGRRRPFLVGSSLSLADLHLGAMVAYFTAADEGRIVLARHPKLSEWWAAFSKRRPSSKPTPACRHPDHEVRVGNPPPPARFPDRQVSGGACYDCIAHRPEPDRFSESAMRSINELQRPLRVRMDARRCKPNRRPRC